MNEREICEHLDLKFKEFLQIIECQSLVNILKEKLYFAGGCIYCLRNDKQVKDYDMFLTDDDIIEDLKKLDIWSFVSEYALTYGKFQIVIKFFGEPTSCVGQFDFKHNMHYYIPGSMKIRCAYEDEIYDEVVNGVFGEELAFEQFEYLNTDELIFNENRARNVEGVWLRIEKFTARGMKISKETKKKIKQRTTKKNIRIYKKSRTGGRSHYQ